MKLKVLAILISLLVAWPAAADDALNWDRMTEREKAEALKKHQAAEALKLYQKWKQEQKQHQDLKRRDKNVSEIQKVLNKCGFNPGPIDGTWGNRTERAAKAYVRAHGGEPNKNSRTRLMAQIDSYRVENAEPCPPAGAVDWERRWSCTGVLLSGTGKLELYQKKVPETGKVVHDGLEIDTDFRVEGLERLWLWDFNFDDGYYNYYIALQGGRADYFDFKGIESKQEKQSSKSTYFCE